MNRINHKLKLCQGPCGEEKVIWKNHEGKRYCKQCWSCQKPAQKPTARKPIAHSSPKRSKEERVYQGKRIIFLNKHPLCEMRIPNICTNVATDIHHMEGRTGDNYLDDSKWKAGCRQCHNWVEDHPKEAKELGLSLRRI